MPRRFYGSNYTYNELKEFDELWYDEDDDCFYFEVHQWEEGETEMCYVVMNPDKEEHEEYRFCTTPHWSNYRDEMICVDHLALLSNGPYKVDWLSTGDDDSEVDDAV
ncbi:hypothetical protein I204_00081 [Kwoniella mangroviensis CBS 8886]|nr:hypothetical protein I204_00081 [Kwoniella mangroviensis CBS 8886]